MRYGSSKTRGTLQSVCLRLLWHQSAWHAAFGKLGIHVITTTALQTTCCAVQAALIRAAQHVCHVMLPGMKNGLCSSLVISVITCRGTKYACRSSSRSRLRDESRTGVRTLQWSHQPYNFSPRLWQGSDFT